MKSSYFLSAIILIAATATIAGSAVEAGGFGRHFGGVTFEALDKDGNGEISREELSARREVQFQSADTNGDGTLDRSEMLAAAQKRVTERVDHMIETYDGNGDGKLALDEMPGQRGKEKGKRKERRAGRWFDRMDADGSGGLSAEEFAAAQQAMKDRHAKHRDHDDKHDGKQGGKKD